MKHPLSGTPSHFALTLWLSLSVVISAMSGLIYFTVQQSLRQSANDPQIQVAEDLARQLSQDQWAPPPMQLPAIEISQSLAPYWMVFNAQGQLVNSNATLDGKPPHLPAGVFSYAQAHGQDRVSWQPRAGVRSAVVIIPYQGLTGAGYVAAGRSLREVEKRETQTEAAVFLFWLATEIATGIAVLLPGWVLS